MQHKGKDVARGHSRQETLDVIADGDRWRSQQRVSTPNLALCYSGNRPKSPSSGSSGR